MEQKSGFSAKVQNLARSVSEKSGEMMESAKLNSEISRIEAAMEDMVFELGQTYYTAHRDDASSAYFGYIQKIMDCEREIRVRQERILAHKGLLYCPHCDTVVSRDDEFCSKCGGWLPSEQEGTAERPCRNCGTLIPFTEGFCPACGFNTNGKL